MVSILLNCTTQTVAMLITAWVLALLILPLRAAIVKFVPVSAFKFMEKVNLETDESDNCLTRCYASVIGGKKKEKKD